MSKKFYQRKDSPWLREHLKKLQVGTPAEKQVLRNATQAISKALSDPLHHEFKKDLPDNYKAVDVLQQYRLFFKIENDSYEGAVVYFAWMNDESSLHRTSKADDCYAVLRELINRGEIEPYQPQAPEQNKENFHLSSAWGSENIYAKFERIQKNSKEWAKSFLYLSKTQDSEYRIDSVSVSKENQGLASSLLKNLCQEADHHKITLIYELFIKGTDASKSRHLLSKSGFELLEPIDDVEIWVRKTGPARRR